MDARSEALRMRDGLGIWVWLPIGALLALYVAIAVTPGSDCDGVADDNAAAAVVVIAVAAVISLCSLAAAAYRAAMLHRGSGISRWQIVVAFAVVALLALLSTALDIDSGSSAADFLWGFAFLGMLATAAALLVLLVAWLLRRKPDQVGLLLPLYLLGAALFVYPGFALLALVIKSGAVC